MVLFNLSYTVTENYKDQVGLARLHSTSTMSKFSVQTEIFGMTA